MVSSLTRRLFLKSAPSALAVAGAVAAPSIAEAATPSPKERFAAALAEFKAAAEALDPRIYGWNVKTDGKLCCSMVVSAYRHTTTYEGDGWYETLIGEADHDRAYVERSPKFDKDGERWFRVTTHYRGHRRVTVTPERHFTSEYGRKIS
jgi:hypothetical protein